ncbi:mannan endo-1,4-beta-mannosidase [Synchytrium endobioticum]|uniref:Mannan endo-1,4-beta-mannosidase n=1 Tax=Synchytrium endobioticum TaxID=286115 RepID=A0A507CR08_9FUNG|nr:mannan endo-1,4-beta-mannosidase [Synchytrium endobioticum]TPX41574.1 mannan endo-1,4-beta-mannosidase [Synchytrium endobioticum]
MAISEQHPVRYGPARDYPPPPGENSTDAMPPMRHRNAARAPQSGEPGQQRYIGAPMPSAGKSSHSNRRLCAALFWIKTAAALALSLAGLSVLAYMIHQKRAVATAPKIIIDPNSPACQTNARTGLGRLEPPSGKMMWGFALNWAVETPSNVSAKMGGLKPAVIAMFATMTATEYGGSDMLRWMGQQCALTGSMLEVTMEPIVDIATIPDSLLVAFAKDCAYINSQYGVPILLRFGHEMNGYWTFYGLKPTMYTTGFRRMTNIMRQYSNLTAMLWAPNVGYTYPFSASASQLPAVGSADWKLLDTNSDGIITGADDPYGPFYPGDEYVDWVGLSIYVFQEQNINTAFQSTYFADYMAAFGPTIDTLVGPDYNQTNHDFYTRFASGKNKPMCLPESGSPYHPAFGGTDELTLKQSWWRQLYSANTFNNYPLLKLIVNFEEMKNNDRGIVSDWRQTANPTVLAAYIADFPSFKSHLAFGGTFGYDCAGTFQFFNS